MTVFDQLENNVLIPVIVLDDVDAAIPMAEALVESGVTALEVTLRTPKALDVIAAIAKSVPQAVVGAGTVIRSLQFQQVADAGGRFVVSPGFTEKLADSATESGLPWLPGVATAGEVIHALENGFTELKFFPASVSGGPAALKGFGSVFQDVSFCPTGGINPDNMNDYLSLDNVSAIGGSWLVTPDDIQSGNWAGVQERARTARVIAEGV